jgi:protein NrfC
MAEKDKKKLIPRRDFLTSAAAAAGALSIPASASPAPAWQRTSAETNLSYAASQGYLVYDSRLCLGCQSCMFMCSLVHEGEANPSLSRIQIIRDAPSFARYPYDITVSVCRQCVTPLCVQNCPTGACHVEPQYGNVRMIDESKCVGCKTCIQSCPQRPHRTVWNPVRQKSTKCDLCANTPYRNEKGGPAGIQACISNCPAKALKLVAEAPSQSDIAGYDVDLAPATPPKPAIR